MEHQRVELASKIVAAYLRKNVLAPDALTGLIQTVYRSLSTASGAPIALKVEGRPTPAVPVRRSVTDAYIVCLECGYRGQMLKRHMMTAHNISVDDYRTRWGLGANYPMVAPNYAARRSELAKQIGLGTMRMRQPEPELPPAPAKAKRTSQPAAQRRRSSRSKAKAADTAAPPPVVDDTAKEAESPPK